MTWGTILFLVLVGLALPLVWRFDPCLRRFRAYEAELAARDPVPDSEFFHRYFAADEDGDPRMAPDVPTRVRRIFAEHMEYPAEKLRPDDDLTFFWAELDMFGLIQELQAGFEITITDEDLERTPCTIRGASLLIETKRRITAAHD